MEDGAGWRGTSDSGDVVAVVVVFEQPVSGLVSGALVERLQAAKHDLGRSKSRSRLPSPLDLTSQDRELASLSPAAMDGVHRARPA